MTGPEDVTVPADETASFQVTVSGGSAPYTYQWETLLVGKTNWQTTTLNGYNTDTLSFTALANYKNRQYRCVVTDAAGKSVTSDAAILTIEEDVTIDGVVYARLADNSGYYVKQYNGNAANVEVRGTVNDMTVTEIGENAFMGNTTLVSVDLPDSIVVIRARAFKDCINLKEMK